MSDRPSEFDARDGGSDVAADPSRVEAAAAGVRHEQAEADAGGPPRRHVSADELDPDALAQAANADVERPEPFSRLALLVVALVAVAVTLAVVAVAVAVGGP